MRKKRWKIRTCILLAPPILGCYWGQKPWGWWRSVMITPWGPSPMGPDTTSKALMVSPGRFLSISLPKRSFQWVDQGSANFFSKGQIGIFEAVRAIPSLTIIQHYHCKAKQPSTIRSEWAKLCSTHILLIKPGGGPHLAQQADSATPGIDEHKLGWHIQFI